MMLVVERRGSSGALVGFWKVFSDALRSFSNYKFAKI
jgi:hypothetical protein